MNFVLEKPPVYEFAVDYDGLWKKLIYELFEEFVLFFAADLYEDVDFLQEPELLQQELFQEIIQEKKGRQGADQIVKVCLKNGGEKWILIHIEVQGNRDPDFSKRMFRYYYKIFDKYNHDIVTIALLTDDSKHFRPNQYQYESYGTILSYHYNAYKLSDYHEEELLKSNNPFAIAVLAANYANEAKRDDLKRYRFKSKLIRLLLQRNDQPREEFILTKEELDMMYIDRKNPPPTWGEVKKLEREEGMEIGNEEARRAVARKMLKEGLSIDFITKMTELTVEEIQKL